MRLDSFMETAREVVKSYGNAGVELKHAVPEREERLFVIPFGDPSDETNYVSRIYTGEDAPGYLTGVLWLNTTDLTPEFKTIANVGDKQNMISRLFMLSKNKNAQWYRELGYVGTRTEERQAIAAKQFNEEAYKGVYPHGTFFDGNLVMPQIWHNIPLIEIEMVEKAGEMEYIPINLVWLKLKPNQFKDFCAAFAGLKTSPKDYGLQWKLVTIANSGEGTSRYSFSRGEGSLPEGQRIEFKEFSKQIEEHVFNFYRNLYVNQHDSNVDNAEAVQKYLLSITEFSSWEAFVSAYSLSARPVDGSKLKKAGSLTLPA